MAVYKQKELVYNLFFAETAAIAEKWIRLGANVNTFVNCQWSQLHHAVFTHNIEVILVLLKYHANINIKNEFGETPLHYAVDNQDMSDVLKVVRLLIDNGADLNITDKNGNSPLHRACEKGSINCVQILVESGADITIVNKDGSTPFLMASIGYFYGRFSDKKILRYFLNLLTHDTVAEVFAHICLSDFDQVKSLIDEGIPVTSIDSTGTRNTLLHYACKTGNLNIVNYLILKGSNIKQANKIGNAPLEISCQNKHWEIAKTLIEREAKIIFSTWFNEPMPTLYYACKAGNKEFVLYLLSKGISCTDVYYGWPFESKTPLYTAYENGHLDIVDLFLEHGANGANTSNEFMSPLARACAQGHVEFTQRLIRNGAIINIPNKKRYPPLCEACRNGNLEIIDLLFAHGANQDIVDKSFATPFHYAVEGGHMTIVQMLISRGINIYALKENGDSALHVAAAHGHTDIFQFLLDSGLNMDVCNKNGDQPLHYASEKGKLNVVQLIHKYNSNMNLTNNDGCTPLHLACVKGDLEMVHLLQQLGADITIKDKYGMTPTDRAYRIRHSVRECFHSGSADIFTQALKEGSVLVHIIKLVLMGPPAAGKTSFLHLLFNWPAPRRHHSTAIASRPIRAIERIVGEKGGNIWEKMEGSKLLKMVMEALPPLLEEDQQPCNDVVDDEISLESYDFIQDAVISDNSDNTEILPPSEDYLVSISNIELHQSNNDVPVIPPRAHKDEIGSGATRLDPKAIIQSDASYYSEKILNILAKGNASKELYTSTWIHVLDSGGQPQFADVSRAFLQGNCLNIIVTKLNERLSDKPNFLYSIEGKPLNQPSSLQMTNIELIEFFVRSIASAKHTVAKGFAKVEFKPRFCIVGTNFDRTQGLSAIFKDLESLQEKNALLLAKLKDFHEHLIFYNEVEDELIFPVNNMCTKNRDKLSEDIRKRITGYDDVAAEVEIPIRWYVFEIRVKEEMRYIEHGMVSLEKCLSIGTELGMKNSDTILCIEYLHSLSLVLHFSDVIDHVIFTNPQYLVNLVTNIIGASFIDPQKCMLFKDCALKPGWNQKLRKEGVFESQLLDAMNLDFVDGLFSKDDFLLLMEHLLIISPLKNEIASPSSKQYFMPVVLPCLRISHEEKARFTQTCQPMVLQFENKIVPQGVFPATIVSLLNRKSPPFFKLDVSSPKFSSLLRYSVKLYCEELGGSVLLVDSLTWIEVYFTGLPTNNCSSLNHIIEEAVCSCAEPLSYEATALKFIVGVLCRHPDHVNDSSITPHPAKLIPPPTSQYFQCTLMLELKPVPLDAEREAPWFPDPKEPPSQANITKPTSPLEEEYEENSIAVNVDPHIEAIDSQLPVGGNLTTQPLDSLPMNTGLEDIIMAKPPVKRDLLELLTEISYLWFEIGEALEIKFGVLQSLKYEASPDFRKLSCVIQEWLDADPQNATWAVVINAVECPIVNKSNVAQKIRKHLLE